MKPVVKTLGVLSLIVVLAACGEKKEETATGPVDAAPAAPAAPAPAKEEPGGWVPPAAAPAAPTEAPAAAPAEAAPAAPAEAAK